MSHTITQLKKHVSDAVSSLGCSLAPAEVHIEYPALMEHGDYATNVAMQVAKDMRRSPNDVAADIVKALEHSDLGEVVARMEVKGPGFINFYLKQDVLVDFLEQAIEGQEQYGISGVGDKKKILIEYSSPNANKPLHLGHLRNNFIGMALGNLMKQQGYDVMMTEIVNDRGMGISKSMLAYSLWGNGATPSNTGTKGDHLVGEYYVRFAQEATKDPTLERQAAVMLQKWETDDPEVRGIWEQMREWTEEGYKETYEKIGSHFDMHEHESDIYMLGKVIVLKALDEGFAEEIEGGAVAVDLSASGLGGRTDGKKVLIKSDGTAVYMTQDLYLALDRWKKQKPEKVLYVVGDEQIYHFKVLFTILKLFGFDWVEDHYLHIPYGMVSLPEGKMKSREGTVVDADDLIAELEDLAEEEIKKRDDTLPAVDLGDRAQKVALAALKFYILKVDPKSRMIYDPKVSLDFEGATGPYVQYTYARLTSILEKYAGKKGVMEKGSNGDTYEMTERERMILLLLSRYPEVVAVSAERYAPHWIAEYLLEFSSVVNSWYADTPVLKAAIVERAWRLQFIEGVRVVLRNGLHVLGIDVLERM